MRDDLGAVVEELYRAFAHVRLADQVDYCDHCVAPEQVEALRRTPLRQLTSEQLGPLLFNAMYTWGDLQYFTHFLPRVLELVAAGGMENWSYPITLSGRLGRCWTEGTAEEQSAIAGFLQTWWLTTVSSWPSTCTPLDILETIDGAGQRVTPYLAAWHSPPGLAPARQLAAFIQSWMPPSMTGDQIGVDIDRWIQGPQPGALLTRALLDTSDPSILDEICDAEEALVLYQSFCKEADQTDALS